MGNFTIWPPKRSKICLVAFIVVFFILATSLTGCILEEDTNENANINATNTNQAVNENQNTNTVNDNTNTNAATNKNTNTTTNTNKTTSNTNKAANTNQTVTTPTVTPTETVNTYMKYTMGTIPGAAVDYEAAKEYLTDTMLAQFTDITFIPVSYCMQLGPDDAKIESEDTSGQTATVRVSGQYSTDPFQEMWDFSLVVVDGEWKIDQLECLLGF